MSEIVTLTNYQISLAAQVGCMRVTETLRMKQSWVLIIENQFIFNLLNPSLELVLNLL